VQAAELGDQLVARPEVEVVGVAEHDPGAERVHLVRVEGLDRRLGADRHEGGRLDLAVRSPEHPSARPPVLRRHLEDTAARDRSRRRTRVTDV